MLYISFNINIILFKFNIYFNLGLYCKLSLLSEHTLYFSDNIVIFKLL